MTITYTGGIALDLVLPSGPRRVNTGDTLDGLDDADTEALSQRPDFTINKPTTKSRRANTTAVAATREN